MRYVKVFFQKIVSSKSKDYWWAYSQQPSFTCKTKLGKTDYTCNVTTRGTIEDPLTMWLGDITDEEAKLWREKFGSTAYLEVDADNCMTLVSKVPEGSTVVASITASAV